MHLLPAYRRKLGQVPLNLAHPTWVDDPDFDLSNHLIHHALPEGTSLDEAVDAAVKINEPMLDRTKPLWMTYVITGVPGKTLILHATHHCMIDGASGVDLAYILLSPSPEVPEYPDPPLYTPRPAPTRRELVRDEIARRMSLPLRAARGIRSFLAEAEDVREEVSVRARAIVSMLGMGTRADASPLNGKVGPHRRFDWLETPLEELKAIRRAWGCTINDVVLTVVTGAVRDYLIHRAVNPANIEFRVSAPVSVRSDRDRGQMGNRVSSWLVTVPIGLDEPKQQLEAIRAETERLKETRQALGVEMMMQAAEWAPSTLMSLGAQSMSAPTNTIVTNVPGPQIQLYCHGAPLRAIYPQVPLLENMGIGIALISYAGSVCWGFNADPDIVPAAFRTFSSAPRTLSTKTSASGTMSGSALKPQHTLPA